jgi:hypothetical protein
MNTSMTIWDCHGEIRKSPGTFVMLDEETFPWTPNNGLRVAGKTKSRQPCNLQQFQNI